jgi:hypothetical protein
MSDAIYLPEFPKEKEFEEYIAAFLQANNLYVERNIVEREKKKEFLELDVITTDYFSNVPTNKLYEMKSGGWGFADIFKIYGQMKHLNIDNGVLIVKEIDEDFEVITKKADKLNIKVIHISNDNDARINLEKVIDLTNLSEEDITTWRFSNWVERKMISDLKAKKKDRKLLRYDKINTYYNTIKSSTFFERYIRGKIKLLHNAYIENANLSACCASEMLGQSFYSSEALQNINAELFSKTFYDCEYNDLQISSFVEYFARISVLKNITECLIYESNNIKDKTDHFIEEKINLGGRTYKIIKSITGDLTYSFEKAIKSLSKHKYFRLYPIFWQWFLWAFGGFILNDYKELEYKNLSIKTGVPINEIDNALSVFDLLFPIDGGWFKSLQPHSNIKVLKMFSVPFRGIGVNYRRLIYAENKSYEDLKLTSPHTKNDLIKFVNCTFNLLNK